jgi:hypothetical protein
VQALHGDVHGCCGGVSLRLLLCGYGAVKKINGDLRLLKREFRTEVETLSSASMWHEHLCPYMANGRLHDWLHDRPGRRRRYGGGTGSGSRGARAAACSTDIEPAKSLPAHDLGVWEGVRRRHDAAVVEHADHVRSSSRSCHRLTSARLSLPNANMAVPLLLARLGGLRQQPPAHLLFFLIMVDVLDQAGSFVVQRGRGRQLARAEWRASAAAASVSEWGGRREMDGRGRF